MRKYTVAREHSGDKDYKTGDTRLAEPTDVAHLLRLGVLVDEAELQAKADAGTEAKAEAEAGAIKSETAHANKAEAAPANKSRRKAERAE